MAYLVLKSCFAAGERRNAGDIVELFGDEALTLQAIGRVEVAPAPKPEPKAEPVIAATNRVAKPAVSRAKK